MSWERNFYPMPKGEKTALGVLILAATAAFLPIARSVEVAGMVLSGWLMAGLMLLAPILTLCVFRHGRPRT